MYLVIKLYSLVNHFSCFSVSFPNCRKDENGFWNELFNIIYNFVFFCFEVQAVQAVQVQVDFLGFLMFQVVFYEVY